jgi:hypothetical protein
MSKFRKIPVVIEAVEITAADYNPGIKNAWDGSPFKELPEWLGMALEKGTIKPHTRNGTDYAEWDIHTLEGVMNATAGDWIIQGVNGEIYSCKPDIFEKTYEAA